MKERHWTSLVTSLRHGQCVLVLGPEVPVEFLAAAPRPGASDSVLVPDVLTRELVSELEEDNRRVTGNTLAAIAQQYEDAEGFGPNAMRALAEKFYKARAYGPSGVHQALASLPFGLILTTCQDDLLT